MLGGVRNFGAAMFGPLSATPEAETHAKMCVRGPAPFWQSIAAIGGFQTPFAAGFRFENNFMYFVFSRGIDLCAKAHTKLFGRPAGSSTKKPLSACLWETFLCALTFPRPFPQELP